MSSEDLTFSFLVYLAFLSPQKSTKAIRDHDEKENLRVVTSCFFPWESKKLKTSYAWWLGGYCWSDSPLLGHSQLKQISNFLTNIERYVQTVFKISWAKWVSLVTGFIGDVQTLPVQMVWHTVAVAGCKIGINFLLWDWSSSMNVIPWGRRIKDSAGRGRYMSPFRSYLFHL